MFVEHFRLMIGKKEKFQSYYILAKFYATNQVIYNTSNGQVLYLLTIVFELLFSKFYMSRFREPKTG